MQETVVGGSVNDIVGSMSEFFALIDDRDAVVPRLRTLRILKAHAKLCVLALMVR